MIVTRPRGAIVRNPALDRPDLRWARKIQPPHRVDLRFADGRRFARLYGEDRDQLGERARRWTAHVSRSLVEHWPDKHP